jgi:hypothetical protein
MKSNASLGRFMTFIELLGQSKNEVVAGSNPIHTQPAAAGLLPLTRFLRAILDRVGDHEHLQAGHPHPVEIVFRIGTPE